jgi:histidyl-tRNA synthetase
MDFNPYVTKETNLASSTFSRSNISLCAPLQVATPILEHASVFERTLGEDSDIIGKELYTFQDKSGDQLTMRPEGTAGAARALLSNNLTNNLPVKWYYHGPMFRHERPQKGRFRQVSVPI